MHKQILIVEDTADLMLNISELLKMEGHEVSCAINGKEALKHLKKNTPDLIITDLIMPVMDGFELIQQIRKNSVWNSVPILVFSAMPPVENEKRVMELGANSYIKKPSTLESFVDAINKLL
jgi:DNA-binding response OmpR family regulator